jgi:dihydroflavonol-4-reductase
MKVFVTGANGLLGCNIVRTLLAEGHEVRAIIRKGANTKGLEGTHPEVIQGDILDRALLLESTKGFEAIVHVAAKTDQWPTQLNHYEAINLGATKIIADIIRKNAIQRLVHVSTANCFGFGTKESPGTEESPYRFQELESGYISSKFLAQQFLLDEVKRSGLPAVIVNPTFMIGPYDAKPSSGSIIQMARDKKVQVFPTGGKNFIHVKDAAAATCNALNLGTVGECYLLANDNLTYREFFDKVNRVTGKTPLQLELPRSVINATSEVAHLLGKVVRKQFPLNKVNAQLLIIGNYYSGKKAQEHLKMPQTPVEDAIREAINWWSKVKD